MTGTKTPTLFFTYRHIDLTSFRMSPPCLGSICVAFNTDFRDDDGAKL